MHAPEQALENTRANRMDMHNATKAKRDAIAARLDDMAKPPAHVEKAAATVDAALAEWKAEAAQLRAEMEILDAGLGVSTPIDPAIGATARAQRAAAERERQERWHGDHKAILDLEAARLKAWSDLQEATEAQRDALVRIFAANDRMSKLWHSLTTTRGVPNMLNAFTLAERLGGRICSVLATIKGRSALGGLRWANGDRWRHPDWAGAEERAMGRQLVDLQKLQPKGN